MTLRRAGRERPRAAGGRARGAARRHRARFVMHVNNETGVIQDIAAIGALCRERGVAFHTDASQSVGKLAVDVARAAGRFPVVHRAQVLRPEGHRRAVRARRSARAAQPVIRSAADRSAACAPARCRRIRSSGSARACDSRAARRAAEPRALGELRDAALAAGSSRSRACISTAKLHHECPESSTCRSKAWKAKASSPGSSALAVTTGSACSSASGEPSLRAARARPRHAARAELAAVQPRAVHDEPRTSTRRSTRVRARSATPAGGLAGGGVRPARAVQTPAPRPSDAALNRRPV